MKEKGEESILFLDLTQILKTQKSVQKCKLCNRPICLSNFRSPVREELNVRRDGYHETLMLPAQTFDYLPGGCQGVQ